MHRSIEALEHRIAPAAVFTYTESDGDLVTVKTTAKVTKEYFESLALIENGRLEELNLTSSVFRNSSLTITVKADGGDGVASIGDIYSEVDLKNVVITGDIESITVGDQNLATPALSKLQARNLGGNGDESFFRGDVKSIKLSGDLTGNLVAGVYESSEGGSYFYADSTIQNLNVKGSIKVAEGGIIPQIDARRINSLVVGGDVEGDIGADLIKSIRIGGSLLGGTAETYYDEELNRYVAQGTIDAGIIKSVRIGGSIVGGLGDDSGGIYADIIGSVSVTEDVIGDAGDYGGYVYAGREFGKVIVGGSVIGGSGEGTGIVGGSAIGGLIRIGNDVEGGRGNYSGKVVADEGGSIDKLTIGGSILGGGEILEVTDGNGNVVETLVFGEDSGQVDATTIGSIRVGGSLVGSVAPGTGSIFAQSIGSVYIGDSIIGGDKEFTGSIDAGGVGTIRVVKDVIGGTGYSSGNIVVENGITSVKIGGNLQGDADRSGSIVTLSGGIDSISIGGSLSNSGDGYTGIFANGSLGKVSIGQGVNGGEYGALAINGGYNFDPQVPSIGTVSIKGDVTNLLIEAGAGPSGGYNTDATIESVSITGNFITSSIVAGTIPGADGFYGTDDDANVSVFDETPELFSRIAKVVIGGTATGSALATEGYGIFAQHIVSLKVNGAKQALDPNEGNDLVAALLSGTTNVRYAELPVPVAD